MSRQPDDYRHLPQVTVGRHNRCYLPATLARGSHLEQLKPHTAQGASTRHYTDRSYQYVTSGDMGKHTRFNIYVAHAPPLDNDSWSLYLQTVDDSEDCMRTSRISVGSIAGRLLPALLLGVERDADLGRWVRNSSGTMPSIQSKMKLNHYYHETLDVQPGFSRSSLALVKCQMSALNMFLRKNVPCKTNSTDCAADCLSDNTVTMVMVRSSTF
ncbi:hypothetical protein J6590_085394 [Homalodisca vitripennis]|nr:hypothetical protein J6590_085394 [Homalodisca vitripennis]